MLLSQNYKYLQLTLSVKESRWYKAIIFRLQAPQPKDLLGIKIIDLLEEFKHYLLHSLLCHSDLPEHRQTQISSYKNN
jgi:hypothetical protein